MARSKAIQRKHGAEPRHRFVLNPYTDARFSRCPRCDALMKVRKIPLLIHIEPKNLLALRKTAKLCPPCDLLIVHQNELEAQLSYAFRERDPDSFSSEYLVMGTVETVDWKAGLDKPSDPADLLERFHPFREQLEVKVTGGWMPIDAPEAESAKKARRR